MPTTPADASPRRQTVALVGNPNTGKTTLYNALTGFRRHVANYPGVTVELARGPLRGVAAGVDLLDLPGTYSLSAQSPDERVVYDVLAASDGTRPDLILAIADASNLPRNLYLVSHLLELGLPVVVALNMTDVAEARGLRIDAAELARRLGVPVVPIVATRDATLAPLRAALQAALAQPARAAAPPVGAEPSPDAVRARYARIQQLLEGVLSRPAVPRRTASDRIDAVLTHRFAGALVLLAMLTGLFQLMFQGAGPLMDGIEGLFGMLGEFAGGWLPEGALRSMLVDGVIAGVGGVVVFLPQIMILFLAIAILEDCGYMARAAFMMDRLMRGFGLSGRAFIPLLSAFACAIPAIMGTRVIADRRERFITILLAPFMSCSARLPVYALFIGAFVSTTTSMGPWLPGFVMLGMYLVGVLVALPLGWILKRCVFAGPQSGFVIELPSYKWPRLRTVWHRVWGAAGSFLLRAGTVVLAVNLVVWVLQYFPRSAHVEAAARQGAVAAGLDEAATADAVAGAYLRDSYLGRLGHAIEPALAPLDWDWRIGIAVLASFPAREVVVATLGTIFNLGPAEEADSLRLREAIAAATRPDGRPLIDLPIALSIMVFFALCAQCSSTLVILGREMRSVAWPIASFVGMTALAYVAAFVTLHLARALGAGTL